MVDTIFDQQPFDIIVEGAFPPDRLVIDYDPRPRASTTALDALIDVEWTRQSAAAQAASRLLFNGEMLRYVGHTVQDDDPSARFILTTGPTCYRDFVGTNLYNGHRIDEFGWECFANPIGTTATLMSSDGLICYGRRSMRVAFHAGYVHTFGGALEARDRDAGGRIDAFESLRRELTEELSLGAGDLRALQCVGLIRDRQIHQPELLFEAVLTMTAAELHQRWAVAEARDEHEALVTFPDRPDDVVPFIRDCGPIAPVAVGALALHGRRLWGPHWWQTACRTLFGS